ncbi:MAG: aminotransferase class I/II-fold pyridoxal phosphate-dependent enzyme [Nitrospinota bacterium]|nr:MAG: aminotransferase class I/II-fold pyridoxal phosphate-dependent enzyme [Nitrospinota bacterium]
MQDRLIDLSSDTATLPTPEMRRFMAEAPVGDEQRNEDPTVNLLQEKVADLLGKEAALFLPSSTMSNEIAFKVHTKPGDEVIMEKTSHPIHFEAGGPAFLSGVMIYPVEGERGIFGPEEVEEAIRPDDPHFPRTRLVSLENTHNMGGGSIWPLEKMEAVCAVARKHGLALHLDGARLMNAVVATGIPAARYAAPFDSVCLCLSKGLGAPVGSVLAGSAEFIREARRYKHLFGGAMRQAGIIAAGGVYALDHHVERLAEDHAHARRLAEGLAEIPGIAIRPEEVETNILFFSLTPQARLSVPELIERLRKEGIRMIALGKNRIRAVTHLNISSQDIETTLAVMRKLLR